MTLFLVKAGKSYDPSLVKRMSGRRRNLSTSLGLPGFFMGA